MKKSKFKSFDDLKIGDVFLLDEPIFGQTKVTTAIKDKESRLVVPLELGGMDI